MAIRNRFTGRLHELSLRTAALVRADAGLYAFIAIYTVFGLGFLELAGASDRAAYAIYVSRWLLLFGLVLPAIALLIDTALLIRRFDRRRSLAARKVFSPARLAGFLAGLVLLQAMILFQGTFTSIKNAAVVWQHGFFADRFQADLDRAIHLGTDPWRWLHPLLGQDWIRATIEWNYNVLWFVLCFGALFLVATSPKAQVIRTRYLLGFMLIWVIVGNVVAGAFLSAGPAFYGVVTGDSARFAEQVEFLARGVASPNSAFAYQGYLWSLNAAGQTGFGSGISAFPSVHVALATMNALYLAERGRWLGLAGFAYVAVILVSSVYLAWHYAIDGYAAIALVIPIHFLLKRLVPDRSSRSCLAAPARLTPRAGAALPA